MYKTSRPTQDNIIHFLKSKFLVLHGYITSHYFIRRALIIIWHVLGCIITYILAFFIRFDASISHLQTVLLFHTIPILCASCVVVFAIFKLHSGIWTYFSVDDLPRVVLASATTVILFLFMVFLFYREAFLQIPRSVTILEIILLSIWTGGGRFLVRFIREKYRWISTGSNNRKIMLVGSLHDCDLIIRNNKVSSIGSFVGIVTDNCLENNMRLHGIPVYYVPIDRISSILRKRNANYILILAPFNKPASMNMIVENCSSNKIACQFHTIPSLSDLTSGKFSVSCIRNVELEDLLDRNIHKLDRTIITNSITGKRIMVTGAGGSIGAELCRQIVQYCPSVIVLFETNEFSLYKIEQELKLSHPDIRIIPFAGDVRYEKEIEAAMKLTNGLDVIYHAAAYKHVPLMEENIPQCVRNNIIGTYYLAKIAQQYYVNRFIMISTDKAVRPSSIMGACKRVAEQIVGSQKSSKTVFVSVRFGNVLGSNGSVVPLFKEQIKNGGPVTVTSPDVTRFFMTIPEAVDLVLQAGAIGQHGEIMVLEMGTPIKIVDMARKLIELSGLVPDQDIKIEYTGLRNGEKEYEEIITNDENVIKTAYEKIWVIKKQKDAEQYKFDINVCEKLVSGNNEEGLRQFLTQRIPENNFK